MIVCRSGYDGTSAQGGFYGYYAFFKRLPVSSSAPARELDGVCILFAKSRKLLWPQDLFIIRRFVPRRTIAYDFRDAYLGVHRFAACFPPNAQDHEGFGPCQQEGFNNGLVR